MIDEPQQLFTITDLKQYIYCPRIFFYHACLPDVRPVTAKMKHGIDAHNLEQKRSARRTLHQYHIVAGTRQFDVAVHSDRLQLTGQIDEVIVTPEKVIPVDYKLAKRAGYHFKIQLTAYAILLEEDTDRHIKQGYLYLIRSREMLPVRFSKKLRESVERAIEEMVYLTETELIPTPTSYRQRCSDCEFRRFCNDV